MVCVCACACISPPCPASRGVELCIMTVSFGPIPTWWAPPAAAVYFRASVALRACGFPGWEFADERAASQPARRVRCMLGWSLFFFFCERSRQAASLPRVGSTRRPLAVDDSWRSPEPGMHGASRPPPPSLALPSPNRGCVLCCLCMPSERGTTTAATDIPPMCAKTVTVAVTVVLGKTARQPDSQPRLAP